jgi:hypothetical protein
LVDPVCVSVAGAGALLLLQLARPSGSSANTTITRVLKWLRRMMSLLIKSIVYGRTP